MGFLTSLVPWWGRWLAIGGVLVAAVAFGAVRMHKFDASRYEALQLSYAAFKEKVAAQGHEAELQAQKRTEADRKAKEAADAENAKTLAALHNDISRLRRERDRAAKSLVPAAASRPSSPAKACFDRAKLESAIRQYRDAVRGLVDQGSDAVIDLNTAKLWAQSHD